MIPWFHQHQYQEWAEREGELWGESKGAVRLSWFDSPLIGRHLNRLVTGHPFRDWLDHVQETCFPHPAALGLNVGCGHGELERLILERNIADVMHGFDISAKAIESAREQAERAGYAKQAQYFVADANFLERSELRGPYEVVFASMALHHFVHLEKCLDALKTLLQPGGMLIANEFIGPDRFQWTDAQLDLVNRLLQALPLELRKNLREAGKYKERVEKPSLHYMQKHFAFEAVCSERIVPALEERFEIVETRPYGGTLLHLLFEAIMGNFEEERNREHAALVQSAITLETAMLDYGVLQHDHALLICRKT